MSRALNTIIIMKAKFAKEKMENKYDEHLIVNDDLVNQNFS